MQFSCRLSHCTCQHTQRLGQSILGNVLVVGPARCAPRETFLVRGLPGLGGLLATSDDRDANMSVDLDEANGGSCRKLSVASGKPFRAAEVALGGRDLAGIISSNGLIELRLSNRPLLGRERLEALPGGEGAALVLGEFSSCFKLKALARLPSVIRLGSNKGLAGHLPTKAQCHVHYWFLVLFDISELQASQQQCHL